MRHVRDHLYTPGIAALWMVRKTRISPAETRMIVAYNLPTIHMIDFGIGNNRVNVSGNSNVQGYYCSYGLPFAY